MQNVNNTQDHHIINETVELLAIIREIDSPTYSLLLD